MATPGASFTTGNGTTGNAQLSSAARWQGCLDMVKGGQADAIIGQDAVLSLQLQVG